MRAMIAMTIAMTVAMTAVHADPAPGPEGTWHGELDSGIGKLRLIVHVTRGAGGALEATLDSPDQQSVGIALDHVRYDAPRLQLELSAAHGKLDVTLDGDKLTGTWTQGRVFALVLTRGEGDTAPPRRPQEPHRPFPYREQEVTIAVRATPHDPKHTDRINLAGTLTLPEGAGPFPAVVFITGSGPQDRDETILGHKPFLLLADALTRRGIATLRVDDRGVGASGGAGISATTLDFVEDVRSEVAFLAARPEIDTRAIGVIGHSEGAVIGPIVAASSPQVRFVVMLAGIGMDGARVLVEQATAVGSHAGLKPEALERDRVARTALYHAMNAAHDDAAFDAAIKAFFASAPGTQDPQQQAAALTAFKSPWLRAFIALDPVPYLARVRVPVLAIAGDHDLQVLPDNLPLIDHALRGGGNRDVTTKLLPGLNHLFQHSATGAPNEYGTIEETFAPEALSLVCDWLVERARRATSPPASPGRR